MTETPESPAATIRRAAASMRERAQEVPSVFPWRAEGRDVTATQDYDGSDPDWDMGFTVATCARQDEAEHIAAMHPLVGVALAEWLETEAHMAGLRGTSDEGQTFHALKVARAYLGEAIP